MIKLFFDAMAGVITSPHSAMLFGCGTLLLKDYVASRRAARRRKAELEDAERQRRWELEDRAHEAAAARQAAADAATLAAAEAERMEAEAELLTAQRAASVATVAG
jgi:hypothetical protein